MQLSLKIKKIIAREFLFLLLTFILSIGGTYVFQLISDKKHKSISNIENIIIEFNKRHDLYNRTKFSDLGCMKFKIYAIIVKQEEDRYITTEQAPASESPYEPKEIRNEELIDKVFNLTDPNIFILYNWLDTKFNLDFNRDEFKDQILADTECDEYEFVKSFYLHSKELKESFFYKNKFSFSEIFIICFSIFFGLRYLIYAILWSFKTIKTKE